MSEKIKAIRIRQRNIPEVIEIEDTLENLQQEVEGMIEYVTPFEDQYISIIGNEESKINGSYPNRILFYCDVHPDMYNPKNEKVFDILYGNLLVVRTNDDGENISLTDEDIEKYSELFKEIIFFGNNIENGKYVSEKMSE